jgi:hypothetical protein
MRNGAPIRVIFAVLWVRAIGLLYWGKRQKPCTRDSEQTMTDQTSGYGDHAPMPGEPFRDPAPMGPPPPPVENAVRLMFARAAMGVVGLIVLFLTKDSLRDQIRRNDATVSAEMVDTAMTVALIFGSVVEIVFIGLYLLLALQVRKGKNWARIVTLVLAGLGVVLGLASLLGTVPALTLGLAVLTLALDIAIIVLLAQRRSGEFFRR